MALATLALRSPTAPCASATPPCPPFGYASLRVADSTYAKAFADDAFTADSATYKQAMTAYYTAYQQYSSQASSASSKWTEYANGLYAKANISIYGLFA